VEYLSNTLEPTFPDGMDIEIIKEGVLDQLLSFNLNKKEKEHVTYGVYTRPELFRLANFRNTHDFSAQRWTVDYQEDLDFVRRVFLEFKGREATFTYQEVNEFLESNPHLQVENSVFKRNERLHYEGNHG
jgi:spore coat polysaccharide biosynthesis protein SpsF